MTVYNAACIDGASESRIWAGDETWKNHGETTGSWNYSTWFMIHTLLIIGQHKSGFETTIYARK